MVVEHTSSRLEASSELTYVLNIASLVAVEHLDPAAARSPARGTSLQMPRMHEAAHVADDLATGAASCGRCRRCACRSRRQMTNRSYSRAISTISSSTSRG